MTNFGEGDLITSHDDEEEVVALKPISEEDGPLYIFASYPGRQIALQVQSEAVLIQTLDTIPETGEDHERRGMATKAEMLLLEQAFQNETAKKSDGSWSHNIAVTDYVNRIGDVVQTDSPGWMTIAFPDDHGVPSLLEALDYIIVRTGRLKE